MTLQWCISYYCFWFGIRVSGRENISGSYQLRWFHQIKVFFFFLTKDTSYPRYHRCISFFQISVSPLLPCDFHPQTLQRALVPTCICDFDDEREVKKSKYLCSMSAIIIPSKIYGNYIKYFAFTFLATDMYVIIWPPRESEKTSKFILFLNFCLILHFRRQIILIGYFLAKGKLGTSWKKGRKGERIKKRRKGEMGN